jgi:hypothetical protein
MMHARLCFIDAPEPGHFGPELARRKNAETSFAFDLALERELGSGLQANSHVRLADSAEPAR